MTASRVPAWFAVVVGGLAVLAIPAGIGASRYFDGVTLLHALYVAVPAAFVLGVIAWSAARKAAFRLARSVGLRSGGPVRLGRFLAWTGVYLAVTGGIAIGVYAYLHAAQ